ncbi:hypothetical protein KC19_8G086000 [Ceratodon purpureus]|uniref:Uncharacterized protein n=1 Tax=Ceratodon purpureus TaxID=3225 RepID=A0A8T0H1A1_CERPU|nr:hypothetical protein KC19_8G086000 [Ceratodon purpureus]
MMHTTTISLHHRVLFIFRYCLLFSSSNERECFWQSGFFHYIDFLSSSLNLPVFGKILCRRL